MSKEGEEVMNGGLIVRCAESANPYCEPKRSVSAAEECLTSELKAAIVSRIKFLVSRGKIDWEPLSNYVDEIWFNCGTVRVSLSPLSRTILINDSDSSFSLRFSLEDGDIGIVAIALKDAKQRHKERITAFIDQLNKFEGGTSA